MYFQMRCRILKVQIRILEMAVTVSVIVSRMGLELMIYRGGVEYRLPNGKGIRYNSDSSFSGLLDPKR